jgi:hypothetical protein
LKLRHFALACYRQKSGRKRTSAIFLPISGLSLRTSKLPKKNPENLSPKGMFSMFSFEQVIRRIGGVDADFLEAKSD